MVVDVQTAAPLGAAPADDAELVECVDVDTARAASALDQASRRGDAPTGFAGHHDQAERGCGLETQRAARCGDQDTWLGPSNVFRRRDTELSERPLAVDRDRPAR